MCGHAESKYYLYDIVNTGTGWMESGNVRYSDFQDGPYEEESEEDTEKDT